MSDPRYVARYVKLMEELAPLKVERGLYDRGEGPFYVNHHHVEICDGKFLRGECGRGHSSEEAIENHWKLLTELPENRWIVVHALSKDRRAYRWAQIHGAFVQIIEVDSPPERRQNPLSEEQISYVADRFLGWKLPGNFDPDVLVHEPTGTNLLDFAQAKDMVRYITNGLLLPAEPTLKPARQSLPLNRPRIKPTTSRTASSRARTDCLRLRANRQRYRTMQP